MAKCSASEGSFPCGEQPIRDDLCGTHRTQLKVMGDVNSLVPSGTVLAAYGDWNKKGYFEYVDGYVDDDKWTIIDLPPTVIDVSLLDRLSNGEATWVIRAASGTIHVEPMPSLFSNILEMPQLHWDKPQADALVQLGLLDKSPELGWHPTALGRLVLIGYGQKDRVVPQTGTRAPSKKKRGGGNGDGGERSGWGTFFDIVSDIAFLAWIFDD